MLERLKKLIKQNMPDSDAEHATESTKLVDLGIDSIGMMMLSMSMEEEQYLLLAASSSVLVGCPTFFLHHPDFLILKWHGWPVISKGIRKTAFISFLLYCIFKQSLGLS